MRCVSESFGNFNISLQRESENKESMEEKVKGNRKAGGSRQELSA